MQGGLGIALIRPRLFSMGRLLTEPVWIFYRGTQTIDHITQLKESEQSLIGPEGSGTNSLAKKLLDANGVTPENSRLIAMELPAYPDALSSNSVQTRLPRARRGSEDGAEAASAAHIKLMNMAQADALIQRYPYLSAVTLRQGVIDFAKNIPSSDTSLVATKAMLLIRDDLHPALRTLLAGVVMATQSEPALLLSAKQCFNRARQFALRAGLFRCYIDGHHKIGALVTRSKGNGFTNPPSMRIRPSSFTGVSRAGRAALAARAGKAALCCSHIRCA